MKFTKVVVVEGLRALDRVSVVTDAPYPIAFNPDNLTLQLDFSCASGAGAQYAREQFPGVPIEHINAKTGAIRIIGLLLFALCLCACGPSYNTDEVRYTSGKAKATVCTPKKASSRPRGMILAIHGGAFMAGNRDGMLDYAEEFCRRGYVVMTLDYHLSSRPGGVWPVQVEDCQQAATWLKAHAHRYGGNPDKIAALGVSAGGCLAAHVALREHPDRPKYFVSLDGEHDFTLRDQSFFDFDYVMTLLLGHPKPSADVGGWSEAELVECSTVQRVRPDVSAFIVHGIGDTNVYVANSDRLAKALTDVGAPVEYHRVGSNEHNDVWKSPVARAGLHAWLDRNLR